MVKTRPENMVLGVAACFVSTVKLKKNALGKQCAFLVLAPTVDLTLNSQNHTQNNQSCSTGKTVSSSVSLNYEATAVRRGQGPSPMRSEKETGAPGSVWGAWDPQRDP